MLYCLLVLFEWSTTSLVFFGVMFELYGFAGAESLIGRYGLLRVCAVGNAAQLARYRKIRALTC